jgi:hypothetical protein
MAFTTWAAHAANLRNDLATNSWRRKSYTLPDGGSVQYTSHRELEEALVYAEHRAAIEAGSVAGRTYARPTGGPF